MVSRSPGTGGPGGPPPKQRSRWLWWVWGGFGFLSCVGFLIAASKVQNQKFRRASVIAVVGCAISVGSYVIWPPVVEPGASTGSEASSDSLAGTNGVWIVMAVWIGLGVYGLILDGDYKKFLRAEDDENTLRWHSTRAQARAFYDPATGGVASAPAYVAPASSPTPPPQPAAAPVDHLIAQADEYLKTQPPANLPGPMPPNVPVT